MRNIDIKLLDDTRFAEKLTPYIRRLSEISPAIREMYYFNSKYENIKADLSVDLLNEKKSSPVFGTVKKYAGQILVLLSYTCAANCRC